MTSRPITRRRVAAGAAWSVPVVMVSTAAPAFATSGGCPTFGSFSTITDPQTLRVILNFDGADSSWLATVTQLSPMPNESGFFTIPPPQNLYDTGAVRFDFERTYRGGANEDLTLTFNLSRGTQVCEYAPVTVNYFNPR